MYKKTELKDIINRYNITISKSLGQNFLTDGNIISKIVESLQIEEDDFLVEIGPGMGALTCSLSEKARNVVAVEIDRRLIPALKETLSEVSNTVIINEDFLKADLNELTGGSEYKLVGNLPYYITSPIIMKVLEQGPLPVQMVFMTQKEVAERLTAKAGTKDYGAITVAANYYSEVEYLFTVSKEVFFPKPKVDSAVISMKPYKKPPVCVTDEKIFFEVVKAGFGQRRKTLGNSLKQIEGLSPEMVRAALSDAGTDKTRRAETLDIAELAELSNSVTLLLKI